MTHISQSSNNSTQSELCYQSISSPAHIARRRLGLKVNNAHCSSCSISLNAGNARSPQLSRVYWAFRMENERSLSPEIPLRPPRVQLPGNGTDGAHPNGGDSEDGILHSRHTLTGHIRSISSLKFHPHGRVLCSSGSDGFIFLWNYMEGQQVGQLLGHKLGVDEVAWSSDGRYLASASDDKTVKIWDITVGTCVRTMKQHAMAVFSCGWNVQGNLIASGGEDGRVIYWDTRTGRAIRDVACHESYPVSSLEFHRDSSILLSASTDGLCRIWDVSTGHCLKTLVEQCNPAVGSARFSPNGRFILVSHINGTIKLWDYLRTREKRVFHGHVNGSYCIPASFLAAHEAGSRGMSVVSGSEDGSVFIWDLNSRRVQQTLTGHRDVVIATASHPSERIVASGGLEKDREIRVWTTL